MKRLINLFFYLYDKNFLGYNGIRGEGMIKDLLSSFKAVLNDTNMTKGEKVVMQCLIINYNIEMGYAFPKYDQLNIVLSTTRNDTVSKTLKSLVDKGYININKMGRKNVYYINRYLFLINNEKYKNVETSSDTCSKTVHSFNNYINLKDKDIKITEDESLNRRGGININISI